MVQDDILKLSIKSYAVKAPKICSKDCQLGESLCICGGKGYMEISVPFSQSCYELKTALKKQSLKKEKKDASQVFATVYILILGNKRNEDWAGQLFTPFDNISLHHKRVKNNLFQRVEWQLLGSCMVWVEMGKCWSKDTSFQL